jgi:hypothetical protein
MNPLEQAQSAIEHFLGSSKEPVFLEPGHEPIRLLRDHCMVELRAGRLTLHAWDETQNVVRRITAVTAERTGRVELAVERFGKRMGTVLLIDRQSARNHDGDLRASRMSFRERFRRALRRQFPDWRIAELSTEPDLEHSLSPSFPRALLRKGTSGLAAIGAAPESPDPAGALTFGLIWLDYLRRREHRLTVEGLVLFLPAGRERLAALRLHHLNPRAAQFSIFVHSGDGYEDRLDVTDHGNLDTSLSRCTRPSPEQPTRIGSWVEQIGGECPEMERVPRNDGSLSLRVRGLEFARATESELLFGLETAASASASNIREIGQLAIELARMRSPEARNHANTLYSRNPEGWLESQVRAQIQQIDATLLPSPIYGQVPAFKGGDRGSIDLLAVDGSGRLAVLELKASEDIHLPLQALDYWMRVKWHAERSEFSGQGYFPGVELRPTAPRLLLVAPALDFHPSNEIVLRYFSPDIEVERIGAGLEWRKQIKVMFRY